MNEVPVYTGELWDRARAGKRTPLSVFLEEYRKLDWGGLAFHYENVVEKDLSETYEQEVYELNLDLGELVEEDVLRNLLHLTEVLGGHITLLPRKGYVTASFTWWIPEISE